MANLTLSWSLNLMNKNDTISIQVTGGGSGNGIATILNRTADVAKISRDLKEKEIEKAKELGITSVKYRSEHGSDDADGSGY